MRLIFIALFFLSYWPNASAATCQKILSKEGKTFSPADFVPANYLLVEEVPGDLNKDKLIDCVLLIKGTDKNQVIQHEHRGRLDRNRRGIVVLVNRKNSYELVVKNERCLSSENEDGGVYFPPELLVQVVKGNLIFHYGHGRYGHNSYTFRLKKNDLELIGYDETLGGADIQKSTSINFLTRKKQVKDYTSENAEGGDEVFKEVWKKIKLPKPILFSEIKDFDDLGSYMSQF
jgi:hypothetical protein